MGSIFIIMAGGGQARGSKFMGLVVGLSTAAPIAVVPCGRVAAAAAAAAGRGAGGV